MFETPADAVAYLRTPVAIRERCNQIFAAGERGELRHFRLDLDRLPGCARYVLAVIRDNYPDLAVPYHARWRHFTVGGIDRWGALAAARLAGADPLEVARIRFDLAVVSVLLDAGAGGAWRYAEASSGRTFNRSEGLAVASLDMFVGGAFSSDAAQPLRADAGGLSRIDAAAIERGFQVSGDNPLIGVEGRASLLRNLGRALAARPDLFGTPGRIGGLVDHLSAKVQDGRLPATAILAAVLEGFSSIWPGRIEVGGANLGDAWRHPAIQADPLTDGIVPFHKLSQWLSYSLVEPLEAAGIEVTGLDALTGLPEYRNGGLFVDLGVLRPKHDGVLSGSHTVDSELVVEWRALTVCLLDRLANAIRAELNLSPDQLPLAKVLEGGSWAAGRRVAAERRPDGSPPIRIDSDGTVF